MKGVFSRRMRFLPPVITRLVSRRPDTLDELVIKKEYTAVSEYAIAF